MKKIPVATAFIILFSMILFGVFIVNYNSYTNNLNYQFESQASAKLSRINGTTRATLDLRLSNQLRRYNDIVSALKYRGLTYKQPEFYDELAVLSHSKASVISTLDEQDLSPYCDSPDYLSSYYNSLKNGNTILCTVNDYIYFLCPYSVDGERLVIIVNPVMTQDFTELLDLQDTEYNGCTYLINSDGKILASDTDFSTNDNYLNDISQCKYYDAHSHEALKDDLSLSKSGITHYEYNEVDTYAYYSPTVINNLYLIHTAPSKTLDQDAEAITDIARDFMNTELVIVFLLVIVVLFVESFYTIKVNKNRDNLLLEQQRYQIALSQSKDTIWEYDIKSDTMTKSDGKLGLYLGTKVIPSFGKTVVQSNIIHPDDLELFHDFCNQLISDQTICKVELRALGEKSEYIWYELSGTKIYDTDRKPISVIGQTCNINDKKQEIELLRLKAGQDTLTKLYNRSTTRDKVNALIDSIDTPVIIGFLVIDIDHFKELNDKLGHLFGDAVLIDVSGKLNKIYRPCDIIGRIGGDEFVVAIYDAPSVTFVEELAHNTCSLFHDISTGESSSFELTCSIGIALYPSDGTDYDSLYEKAELALCHSKLHGKNQASFYDSAMEDLTQNNTVLEKMQNDDDDDFHHEERSLIDSTIIANAIDILFDSREIDTSIKMILSLIGIYYNLDRIQIIEYSDTDNSVSITHEWYSDPQYRLYDVIQNIPYDNMKSFNYYMQTDDGISHMDEVTEHFEDSDNIVLSRIKQDVSALFQCGISDHGHYIGFFNIAICGKSHKWTKNELDSLSLLSKVIGSYLIHLRSMQKADFITQKDLLTNAYNFNTFLNVCNQALNADYTKSYAMLYSDIFQFKLINDNYGYQAGDKILKDLAQIFMDVGGNQSILCRITGDKFACLVPFASQQDLEDKSSQILALSKQISSLDDHCYKLNVMIGIYPIANGDSAIVAVDRANIARKNAQKLRTANYMFFTEEMRLALIEQKKIEDVMEDALNDNEFIVYYQPKINMNTGKIGGAEALIRWMRPQIGLVSPAAFIPLFEDNGFIIQLDYYVLETVCNHLREAIDRGFQVFPISVNFSREHFKTDELPDHLLEIVNKYKIAPSLIEVEITESAFVNKDTYFSHILQRIRNLGFGLAMDDFGSGLSSLNLLSDLPFKVIKIDKDFFHTKSTHKRERIVISNIVRMAQELDMEVICEGVETFEQSMFLQSIGCYMAQGYYYDKPLPKDVFDAKYLV